MMKRNLIFFKRRRLNIDVRCVLECPNCARQRHFKNTKVLYDISMEEFYKLTKFFKSINFCGQLSDVHHKKFVDMLAHLRKNKIEAIVHNGSSLNQNLGT